MNPKTPQNYINERQSMDDIAASLMMPGDGAAPTGATGRDELPDADGDNAAAVEEAILDQDNEEEVPDDENDDQGDDDLAGDEENGGEEGADSQDDEADDEENDPSAQALADDTKITVTVDGEQREVTLAELKNRYSGEGAIDKRLQEATEKRKEALNLQSQAKQQLETGRNQLVTALNAVMQMVGQPTVQKPDPSLERTNPTQYLLKMEQYRLDQERVQGRQAQLMGVLQQHEARQQHELQQFKAEQNQKLVEAWPDLADPAKAPAAVALVQEAASAYGFSESELSGPIDHRLFLLAADAARYRRMKQKQKVNPTKTNRKLKAMRPGAQSQVSASTKAHKQQKAAIQRARQTGHVDDVAATLLNPSPKR